MKCVVCGDQMVEAWATMRRFQSDKVDLWCRGCAYSMMKTAAIGSMLVSDDSEADNLLRFLRGQRPVS